VDFKVEIKKIELPTTAFINIKGKGVKYTINVDNIESKTKPFIPKDIDLIPKILQKNKELTFLKISNINQLSKFIKLGELKDLNDKPLKTVKGFLQIKAELPSGVSFETMTKITKDVSAKVEDKDSGKKASTGKGKKGRGRKPGKDKEDQKKSNEPITYRKIKVNTIKPDLVKIAKKNKIKLPDKELERLGIKLYGQNIYESHIAEILKKV